MRFVLPRLNCSKQLVKLDPLLYRSQPRIFFLMHEPSTVLQILLREIVIVRVLTASVTDRLRLHKRTHSPRATYLSFPLQPSWRDY